MPLRIEKYRAELGNPEPEILGRILSEMFCEGVSFGLENDLNKLTETENLGELTADILKPMMKFLAEEITETGE